VSTKVVINSCFGGFGLSEEARSLYRKRTSVWCYFMEDTDTMTDEEGESTKEDEWVDYSEKEFRSDPVLVAIVEELGERANGRHAELSVVEIPDDVKWDIFEHDGLEHVAEVHRRWY
jgi:hypothetical protein